VTAFQSYSNHWFTFRRVFAILPHLSLLNHYPKFNNQPTALKQKRHPLTRRREYATKARNKPGWWSLT
jgi:hypothetical protein